MDDVFHKLEYFLEDFIPHEHYKNIRLALFFKDFSHWVRSSCVGLNVAGYTTARYLRQRGIAARAYAVRNNIDIVRAIDEYNITGITTTLGFGKFVMQHEAFTSGKFDTHFVKKYFTPEVLQTGNEDEALIAALVMERLLNDRSNNIAAEGAAIEISSWEKNRKIIR